MAAAAAQFAPIFVGDSSGQHLSIKPVEVLDRETIRAEVVVEAGAFLSRPVIVYLGHSALARFVPAVETLYDTLRGQAALGLDYDGDFAFRLSGNGRGEIVVEGRILDADHNTLSFGFSLDQTYLPRLVADLARLLQLAG